MKILAFRLETAYQWRSCYDSPFAAGEPLTPDDNHATAARRVN